MFGFARFLSESITIDSNKLSQLHAAVMDDMPRDVLADFVGDLGVPDHYADFLRSGNVKEFIEQSQVGARGRGQTVTCHPDVVDAEVQCRNNGVIAGWFNATNAGYVFPITKSHTSVSITVNYLKSRHQFYFQGGWFGIPAFYDMCLAFSTQFGVIGFDVFWLGLMLYQD